MSAAPLLCPQCQTPYEEGDFLCTGCELILDVDAAEANYKLKKPSIVQALLSPPQRRSTGMRPSIPVELKKKGDPEVTVRQTMAIDDYTVPRLLAGMNLALTPLHEFEAMVAAFVDGASTVPQIAVAAEISRVEAMAVFTSLAQRKVIELRREEPKKPEPAPAGKAERRDPITLPPGAVERAPELSEEPPTPPPDEPLPPVAESPPPPRPRTPQPTDVPKRPAFTPSPARLPPVMTPISTPAAAPVMTPSRTPATGTPARGVAVPTPVSTPASTPARGTGLPRASQLQAPSPMASAPKAESVLERAISLERRGEVDGAIHVLKRAITQVKEPAALCNKLALILVNQRRDYKQAEELLNKAIELEPENAVYQQNLFKIIGMAAERKESRGSGGAKSGGFFSKLLKK
ncbi:MAG TPA: hypothetical protein VFA20_32450 [Myxococcaceae bacterium]|nr:hypothetical protein [Myxococcaceae bacterium]